MALNDYYVDPGSGNDTTGDGSSGTPWATVDKALKTITPSAVDGTGDRIYVVAGTDDVLTASLDPATDYGTPTINKPLVIQGYGGIGGISGGGSYSIVADTAMNYINFIDLHLHNSGANPVVQVNDYCNFQNCEVDNTTGNGIECDNYGRVMNCNVHNVGGTAIDVQADCVVWNNHIEDETNDCTYGIYTNSRCFVALNTLYLTGTASDGIYLGNIGCVIANNAIYSTGSSGDGVYVTNASGQQLVAINNLIEGFTTGNGMYRVPGTRFVSVATNNREYGCGTPWALDEVIYSASAGETTSESLFAKVGDPTYANRHNYFRPVDTGGIIDGAY